MTEKEKNELTFILSAFMHESWCGWMRFFFRKCDQDKEKVKCEAVPNMDSIYLSGEYVDELRGLIWTKYEDLTEEKKKPNIEQAARIIEIVDLVQRKQKVRKLRVKK